MAKECYPTKLNLLTNGTVADAIIRFVAHRFKDKIKSPSGSSHEDEKELKEPIMMKMKIS